MSTPRSSRSYFLALALVLAGVSAHNATATAITSTTYGGWTAGLSGSATEANVGAISFTSYNDAAGLTLTAIGNSSLGFTFTGPDNGLYQMGGSTLNGYPALAGSTDAGAGLNIAMPSMGVNAFLLSIGTSGGTPISVVLSDGETFVTSAGLFGVSISHPISSLLLTTSAGSAILINDFYFGASNLTQDPIGGDGSGSTGGGDVTPSAEVATWVMMAGGGLFLFGAVRRVSPVRSL